ncbi:Whole genome shotgun sequence [Vibrio owensii]|uniref:Whole genome shotgun sequence n=1 Tax=Vibrio owensii TaxID=696485 RepID=A0AAU9PYX1_9VIBR|nr:Whole genome shotgun sequence [Vibrio owensii]
MKLLRAKIIEAQVEVQIDGKTLKPNDVINVSAGQADSEGYLIMGDEFSIYITNTQTDAQITIDKLIELTEQAISMAGQNVVVSVSGGSGSPAVGQTQPLDASAKSEIERIKQELEEIKLR